jgi:hypothetical protein
MDNKTVINVAARKVNGEWRGAFVQNDVFADAFIEPLLETLMDKALNTAYLAQQDGTVINVSVVITGPPMVARG